MHTPAWRDDHSRLVAETAPGVESATEADMDRIWSRVAEVVRAPEPPRWRRRRIALGGGVALASDPALRALARSTGTEGRWSPPELDEGSNLA